jgi:hypothetical protein
MYETGKQALILVRDFVAGEMIGERMETRQIYRRRDGSSFVLVWGKRRSVESRGDGSYLLELRSDGGHGHTASNSNGGLLSLSKRLHQLADQADDAHDHDELHAAGSIVEMGMYRQGMRGYVSRWVDELLKLHDERLGPNRDTITEPDKRRHDENNDNDTGASVGAG